MTRLPTRRALENMTEHLTRRAAREAEAQSLKRRRRARPAPVAEPRSAAELSRSRARSRTTFAAGAALLLACSGLGAAPTSATITDAHTIFASQLFRNPQALTVAENVKRTEAELASFDSTVSATSVAASTSGVVSVGRQTNADWAALVLEDASLPVTQNNVTVMLQWMDSENSPRSWWLRNNPLNNGLGSGGGAGLGSYADLATAAQYAAKQLQRSLFAGIAAALSADSSPSVTAQAIMASAWAGSHYGYGRLWHAVDVPIVAAPPAAWN